MNKDDRLRLDRVLRQHVKTDALLGVQSVPTRAAAADHAPVDEPSTATSKPTTDNSTKSPAAPHDRATKLKLLEAMDAQEVRVCTKCPLHQSRTQTVFGEGDVDAPIMFVGEGPGQREDEQGRPFVGRAGELLTKMIVAMGLDRSQVYIANLVKCRPPNNRTPTPNEVGACWDYLLRQVRTIQPRVIVTLGGPATKALLDTREGITRLRGTWHEFEGVPVMPTFHPAYLLRAYTKENRGRVWSDLQAVLKRIGRDVEGEQQSDT